MLRVRTELTKRLLQDEAIATLIDIIKRYPPTTKFFIKCVPSLFPAQTSLGC